MSIDWITVGAQIVNFLVLIWLLKRFLYRPILDGIDAREEEISTRMGEAQAIRTEAQQTEAKYKAEIADLRASKSEMLEKVRHTAEAERDALLAEARARLADEQAEREKHRAEEARAYSAQLHQTGASALVALTGKALSDLADTTLEQQIVAHAAARLKDQAGSLRDAAGDAREAVALTRDPLPDAEQARLRDALAAILPEVTLRFDTDDTLSPGLSLRLGGAQVAWTIDSYLDGLDEMLEDRGGQAMKGLSDAA
ncbi:F0F1 ATP synthase subunit B family protein [Litoreibacter arenae]|uniref:ATP synthase subunit b n=1 Tax=Litoreibacter arenae DSM 19593 TaxID=1123360 RepID=S9RJD5_9RHOB|nr:ATP synthase B chain [Litoreibacter arenae]EPX78225.1 ATP synthase B chain [Litoreibacter arenae DSM 19593]